MTEYRAFPLKSDLSVIAHRIHPGHMATDSRPVAPLVLAFASGKGGVGKTSIVANLGISLAKSGRRVCIFDADTNLANINIMLRLRPEFTIEHFLRDEKGLDEILLSGPGHIRIVPAASGIADLVTLSDAQRTKMLDGLRLLESNFDYLLIDCAAGINDTVLTFLLSSPYVVLVVTSEPTSLTDAYSLLKVLSERGLARPVHTIMNRVSSRGEAIELYRRFKSTAERFLSVHVHTMGYVLSDPKMNESVHQQTANVLRYPDSLSARCISALAGIIGNRPSTLHGEERFSDLWEKLAAEIPTAPPQEADQGISGFDAQAFLNLVEQTGNMIAQSDPADRQTVSAALVKLQSCYHQQFPPSLSGPSRIMEDSAGEIVMEKDRDSQPMVSAKGTEKIESGESDRAGLIHSASQAARLGMTEAVFDDPIKDASD